ncbi:MAG: hypothetical protein IT322_06175 [Anaerolineae bacterium]|nr:hypothetical protein [Anaerolineae bacterium]
MCSVGGGFIVQAGRCGPHCIVSVEDNTPPTYGDPFGGSGTTQTGFGFTGEVTDASGVVYLRARYYVPTLGVFPSLDPVEEGNRYGYVARY